MRSSPGKASEDPYHHASIERLHVRPIGSTIDTAPTAWSFTVR
jgi:hypothetical protein